MQLKKVCYVQVIYNDKLEPSPFLVKGSKRLSKALKSQTYDLFIKQNLMKG